MDMFGHRVSSGGLFAIALTLACGAASPALADGRGHGGGSHGGGYGGGSGGHYESSRGRSSFSISLNLGSLFCHDEPRRWCNPDPWCSRPVYVAPCPPPVVYVPPCPPPVVYVPTCPPPVVYTPVYTPVYTRPVCREVVYERPVERVIYVNRDDRHDDRREASRDDRYDDRGDSRREVGRDERRDVETVRDDGSRMTVPSDRDRRGSDVPANAFRGTTTLTRSSVEAASPRLTRAEQDTRGRMAQGTVVASKTGGQPTTTPTTIASATVNPDPKAAQPKMATQPKVMASAQPTKR